MDVLQFLLEQDKRLDGECSALVMDGQGDTPLSLACLHGRKEAVLALMGVAPKRLVDMANVVGDTPLMQAVKGNHPEIVQLLVR